MSTLFGKSVASTYKDLLQVSNNNIGVDNVVRYIEDGEGTRSALALSTDTVVLSGHLLPQVHEQVDLGSAELKFRHLYLSDNTIYIGDQTFNTTDIKVVKDIQTTATLPISSVVELAQSAAQIGDIDSTFFTDEFLNEYSTVKTQAGTAVQPNTSALFEDVTTSGNLNVGGSITGGEIITIDPAAVGDNTGKVIIAGDLQVDGETTVVNSTTISTSSNVITLAQGATNAAQADGAGLVVDGANATIKYGATNNQWIVDRTMSVPSIVTESLSHSSQINLNVANNLLLDLYSDGSNRNMTVFAKAAFNETLNVGEAVQFGPGGSVGGIVPTVNGQSIVWDGAKWRPAVASTGDSEATEVPASFTQALPTSNTIGNPPGVYTINFAQEYTAPPAITTDLQIEGDLPIIPYVITEVTTTNFTIEFAEPPASLGYTIHVTFGGRDILWKNGELNSIYYDQGDVVVNNMEISGNLSVAGTTTTINSTDLSVRDRNITLADNTLSRDLSGVNGNAGITWGNDNKVKFLYNSDTGFKLEGAKGLRLDLESGDTGIYLYRSSTSDLQIALASSSSVFKSKGQIVFMPNGTTVNKYSFGDTINYINGPKVGIGTTIPSRKLQVVGDMRVGAGDPYDDIVFETQTKFGVYEGVMGILPGTVPGSGTSEFATYFKTNTNADATGSTRHDVLVDGRVGIGTTHPDCSLEISTNETTGLLLSNPDSSPVNSSYDPPAITFQASGWDTDVGSEGYRARIRVNSNYSGSSTRGNTHPVMNFEFETNEDDPDDFLRTKMMINADGQVGIGTTTPIGRLSIDGETALNYGTHITFNNTLGTNTWAIGAGAHGIDNNGFGILNQQTNSKLLWINDNHNVQITNRLQTEAYQLSDSKREWTRTYSVNGDYDGTLTSAQILDDNGDPINGKGYYILTAKIPSTSTTQACKAIVYMDRYNRWWLKRITQSGYGSNHVKFFIDETTQTPTISLYGHNNHYSVVVRHEWFWDGAVNSSNANALHSGIDGLLSWDNTSGYSDNHTFKVGQWETAASNGGEGFVHYHPGRRIPVEDSNGRARFTTGIQFGLDDSSANTLDDFETGFFTPVLNTVQNNVVVNYPSSEIQGQYTKIGNMVHVLIRINKTNVHSDSTQESGRLIVTGLPFARSNNVSVQAAGSWWLDNGDIGTDITGVSYVNWETRIYLVRATAATSERYVRGNEMSINRVLYANATYYTT